MITRWDCRVPFFLCTCRPLIPTHTSQTKALGRRTTMPTLVWIRRPESGSDADDAKSRRRGEDAAAAVRPDPVVSAASAADAAAAPDDAAAADVMPPTHGVPPAFTTHTTGAYYQQKQQQQQQQPLLRRHVTADGTTTTSSNHDGRRKKRKMNRAGQATAAKKKKPKALSPQYPTGVAKIAASGRFQSQIYLGPGDKTKTRYIGCFDTPKQASAAYMSVKKDLDDVEISVLGADEVDDLFDAAKQKAPEARDGFISQKKKAKAAPKTDPPQGVQKSRSGRFEAKIRWGKRQRFICLFDTPEQASAAFMSVRKDRENVELSALGADEVDALFDAAQKKAVEVVGGIIPKKRSKTMSERELPTGVYMTPSGKFESMIKWGGKNSHIGTFDTPEQASAAYMSVRKDRDDAELSSLGADEVDALFKVAKSKVR